jgi:hypothetical protein
MRQIDAANIVRNRGVQDNVIALLLRGGSERYSPVVGPGVIPNHHDVGP